MLHWKRLTNVVSSAIMHRYQCELMKMKTFSERVRFFFQGSEEKITETVNAKR